MSPRDSFSQKDAKRLRILIVRHGETDYNVKGIIQGQMDTELNDMGREQAKKVADTLAHEHIDEVYTSPLKRALHTADTIVSKHPSIIHWDRDKQEEASDSVSMKRASSNSLHPLRYWQDDRLKERGFGSLEGHQLDRNKPRRDSIQGIEQTKDFAARLASFLSDLVTQSAPWKDNGDDTATETRHARIPRVSTNTGDSSGPPPQLNKAQCQRTVLLVAHGAAISALVGTVLLDTGLASMAAGVSRTRVWNCSITEVIVDCSQFPVKNNRLDFEKLILHPTKAKAFMIERWADVRHLPDELDDAAAAKGSADELVGRQTNER